MTSLDTIAELRDHEYDIRAAYWTGDFPAFFREKNPIRIPNMRHGFITVPEFDKNPRIKDMRYLSAWGTGKGVDYNGEVGVVNNIAPYGNYFQPDADSGVQQRLIRRVFVGHKPDAGKAIFGF